MTTPGKIYHGPMKMPCEVWSRIVGYFRPIRNWNQGKRQEFAERKNYDVPKEGR